MTDLKESKACIKQAQLVLDKAVKCMLVGEYDEAEKLTDLYHALINQSKNLLTNGKNDNDNSTSTMGK